MTARKTASFSDDEKAAMKERARELRAEAKRGAKSKAAREEGEADIMAKIAEMGPHDKAIAQRIHEIMKRTVPDLMPKTWYGMPAYAKDGNVVVFFQAGEKFKARYCTIGFSDKASLDDGRMWATSYALTDLTAAEEKKIVALVKKAAS